MQARTQVLRAEGLKKSYGERAAVIDVSREVVFGEVLGLLGQNGAGKSTTTAMACRLTPPDAGRVLVGGMVMARDEAACKRRIGLVPQDLALFEDLPARANVELFGALYGLPSAKARRRATEVLAAVGLADRARDKPATFSGGMKRRLNIACAVRKRHGKVPPTDRGLAGRRSRLRQVPSLSTAADRSAIACTVTLLEKTD